MDIIADRARRWTWRVLVLGLAILAAPIGSTAGADDTAATPAPAFPLKASANNRHLVDRNNVAFLMVGDSPQALIGNLSPAQATMFLNNRAYYGINALWVNLLCNNGTGCNADGTTFDGIAPFTTAGDLATPNPAYFQRAATLIHIAATKGMVVILDPIETIGWLGVLQTNGITKAFNYGKYLGNRFKTVPNIIWMHGNDFQTWRDPANEALVRAVARGIKQTDPNHIHTAELDYYVSASLDDPAFRSILSLDAVYTYRPTYAKVISEYRRPNHRPIFMVEANYEFEHNGGTDGGSTQNLRKQEYWTMLSGATGQLYGSYYTWQFPFGWQTNLNTPGIRQFYYMRRLFAGRRWYDLAPDGLHRVVIGGRGQFSENGSIDTDTYATAARTPDGKLVIAYMPTVRTFVVDMSKLSGRAKARWYDPSNGQFVAISGSPFANSGHRLFRPPGNNHDGDGDWVLVLEAQ